MNISEWCVTYTECDITIVFAILLENEFPDISALSERLDGDKFRRVHTILIDKCSELHWVQTTAVWMCTRDLSFLCNNLQNTRWGSRIMLAWFHWLTNELTPMKYLTLIECWWTTHMNLVEKSCFLPKCLYILYLIFLLLFLPSFTLLAFHDQGWRLCSVFYSFKKSWAHSKPSAETSRRKWSFCHEPHWLSSNSVTFYPPERSMFWCLPGVTEREVNI